MEYVLLAMCIACGVVLVACGIGLALTDEQLDAVDDWMETHW